MQYNSHGRCTRRFSAISCSRENDLCRKNGCTCNKIYERNSQEVSNSCYNVVFMKINQNLNVMQFSLWLRCIDAYSQGLQNIFFEIMCVCKDWCASFLSWLRQNILNSVLHIIYFHFGLDGFKAKVIHEVLFHMMGHQRCVNVQFKWGTNKKDYQCNVALSRFAKAWTRR